MNMAENMMKASVHFSMEFNLSLHCLGFVTIDPSESSLNSLPLQISFSLCIPPGNLNLTLF